MTTQTLARQIVEIAVNGMDTAQAVVTRGMQKISQVAKFAASGVREIATAAGGLARVGGILGGGFLATFGRSAMQNTVESDQLGKSWAYLSRVVGQELAPYVRALTGVILEIANAYRALSPETKQTIMQVALFAAGAGAVLAILPLVVSILGAVGSALALIVSPVGLVIGGFAALVAAGVELYDFFRTESASTGEAVDEANRTWVDKFIDMLKDVAVTGTEIFNAISQGATDALNWVVRKIAEISEAVGLVPEGTADALDEFEAGVFDTGKVGDFFDDVKVEAKKATDKARGWLNGLKMDINGGAGFQVKMAVKFESLQGTFDRLQEAFARGDDIPLQQQQVNLLRDLNGGVARLGVIAGNFATGVAS